MDRGKKDKNAPSSSDPVFKPGPTHVPERFGAVGDRTPPVDQKIRVPGETKGMTLTIGENRGDMVHLYKRKNHVYTEYDTDTKGAAASMETRRQITHGYGGEYHAGVNAFEPIPDTVLKGREVSTVRMNNIHPPGARKPRELHEGNATMATKLHENLPPHDGRVFSVGVTRNKSTTRDLAQQESTQAMAKKGFIPLSVDVFERGGHQPTDHSNVRQNKLSTDNFHAQTKFVHQSTSPERLKHLQSYYTDKARDPSGNTNKASRKTLIYKKQ